MVWGLAGVGRVAGGGIWLGVCWLGKTGGIDVTGGFTDGCGGIGFGGAIEVSPDPGPGSLLLVGDNGLTDGTLRLGPISEIVWLNAGGLF